MAGKIEVVFADVVQAQNGLKKFIRVHIPEGQLLLSVIHNFLQVLFTILTFLSLSPPLPGYDPVTKRVTDQYRVLVSPKKIYLEPLKQLGLHEYLRVRAYNPCYIGRRVSLIPIPSDFHSKTPIPPDRHREGGAVV